MDDIDAKRKETLGEFVNITGLSDVDRAKFFLEASGWNLQVALGSFYEDDSDGGPQPRPPSHGSADLPNPSAAGPRIVDDDDDDVVPIARPQYPSARISTLSAMRGDSSSDDEEGEAFYAGGSERSGQQILGPGKGKKSGTDFVGEMFKAAKESGAEPIDQNTPNTKKSIHFAGTGYRLGATENDSEVVAGSSRATKRSSSEVILKMWKNGFSLDNGPLREFSDPGNRQFLDSIRRGEIPEELLQVAKGGEVNLNMEDHRNEDWVAPKSDVKLFSGHGHMLGSPVPTEVASASATPSPLECKEFEEMASRGVQLDAEQPSTNVQIILADGSRLIGTFNHGHTVSDVRRYIVTARPQYASSAFSLMTSFPNRELSKDMTTLKDACLLNSVIRQRLI